MRFDLNFQRFLGVFSMHPVSFGPCASIVSSRPANNMPHLPTTARRTASHAAPQRASDVLPDTDVAIIGAGLMGLSTAYWLLTKSPHLRVTLIERDPSYRSACTALSVGGFRAHFTEPENVQMSLFGMRFFRDVNAHLFVDERIDLQPHHHGYLFLYDEADEHHYARGGCGAGTSRRDGLERVVRMQHELGAYTRMLTARELAARWPWMNVGGGANTDEEDDETAHRPIRSAIWDPQGGWLDPWLLLTAFRRKVQQLGGRFLMNTSFERFQFHAQSAASSSPRRISGLELIQWPDAHHSSSSSYTSVASAASLPSSATSANAMLLPVQLGVVNAAGLLASAVACQAGLTHPKLPVTPRRRLVHTFSSRSFPADLVTPLIVQPDGSYFRKDSRAGADSHFICGKSPRYQHDQEIVSWDVMSSTPAWQIHRKLCGHLDGAVTDACDATTTTTTTATTSDTQDETEFFEQQIWPQLAHCCPQHFQALKVQSSYAAFYDFNVFDQNLIFGSLVPRNPALAAQLQQELPTNVAANLFLTNGSSGHGLQHSPAIGLAMSELILYGRPRTFHLCERMGVDRFLASYFKTTATPPPELSTARPNHSAIRSSSAFVAAASAESALRTPHSILPSHQTGFSAPFISTSLSGSDRLNPEQNIIG